MRGILRSSLTGLCLVLMTALAPGALFGQAVYGSIFGTVTDPSGAAVPNATVTITETSKSTSVTIHTNADGNFNQTRLVPGTYRVRVEGQGFKVSLLDNIVVNADTASPANIELQTGAVTEEITVTAEAPLLKTDRSDVATTFEEKQVDELPILDRNYTKFLLLTPGTQQLGWQHASSENPQGSVQIIVNGQPFHGTSFQLDGTDNRDPILGIIVINPTLESVTETKITSQNYDAEFGVATAGVATAQTKSGTNDFHGAAFVPPQRRDERPQPLLSGDARNSSPASSPRHRQEPVRRLLGRTDHQGQVFFFGDYQGTRRKNGGSILTTVPTALARTGNLSEYGVGIFDPPLAPGLAREFAGKVIPQGRLLQQALNLIRQLPLPNRAGSRKLLGLGDRDL